MGLKTKTILQISPRFESSNPNSDQSISTLQFHNTQNQNLNLAVVSLWNLPLWDSSGEGISAVTENINYIHSIPVNSSDFGEVAKQAVAVCKLEEVKEANKTVFLVRD